MNIQISNDGLSVIVNGITYHKLVLAKELPDAPKEPELKTFQDCWEKVKPGYWIKQATNTIEQQNIILYYDNKDTANLPTRKSATQIQAAIKLFVIKEALQGDWKPELNERSYHIWYNGYNLKIGTNFGEEKLNPFTFKSKELAQRAIEIGRNIWLKYFGL